MRYRPLLLVLALSPLGAQSPQTAAVTKPAAIAPTKRPGISRQTFAEIEKSFDSQLGTTGGAHPIDILGLTRGIYLEDYGLVFTTEVSLTQTPGLNPFRHGEITQDQKNEIFRQKMENLPLLRKVMRDMVKTTAMTVGAAGVRMNILKPNTQVVLAVRISYLPYEITAGLPGLIVMKADLQSALADNIKVEEQ